MPLLLSRVRLPRAPLLAIASTLIGSVLSFSAAAEQPKQLLWGDTHLHSSYSFDAFLNQNQSADPDTAYRWARGLPVIHPYNRTRIQINTPLDFLVVADHAELMGVMRAIATDTAEFEDEGMVNNLIRWFKSRAVIDAIDSATGRDVFVKILPKAPENPGSDPVQDPANEISKAFGDTTKTETTAWNEILDAAELHNQPGTFTALIGWEWSSIPTGANLHRIVITPDGADKARQFLPYGSDQSQYPEDLWDWLEQTQQRTGARFLAIPHNSNISKGYMFAETTLKGQPITSQYARRRMSWEPVVEITQIKGDSETHPSQSPDDEFADFETYRFYIQQSDEDYVPRAADYVRPALLRGLSIEQNVGVNPYKLGFIGSTDAHTGIASAEENNFWGKMAKDSTPETKRPEGPSQPGFRVNGWNMAAQGLAAVWAEDNNREAIFAAFKRKEVYATTGPRIAVRVFAGFDFAADDAAAEDFADIGYQKGVPMGGDLSAASITDNGADSNTNTPDNKLQLLIRAVKDPKGANLDRLQVVKGWVNADGKTFEKIFDADWSENWSQDSLNGKTASARYANGQLAPMANTVDLATAQFDQSLGSAEFSLLWTDPEFDSQQSAFYYVRVLQVPTPRHSLYDAIALQIDPPEEAPATIQERAYTSAIWYTP